ncbi:nuclear transport factor 2 family protein [Aeoliella sp. ICT_H6.2]|uniref:Nuclear transport factor 2 family protein n=1 Tax=Aeoliella straminimaris TaxID=2954799 RepID=A0A9X2F5Y7_9BACT|nr:nuclear transport factor 2 family protein [Aeoliella straminimaris]MCO6042857.1 nuclear transport factor 2 family protein [Aeoliella straminimaris]
MLQLFLRRKIMHHFDSDCYVPRHRLIFLIVTLASHDACWAQEAASVEPEENQLSESSEAAVRNAIRKSAEDYATSFNDGNAQSIAELYSENAELIDAAGNVFLGRDSIQQEYAAFFDSHPNATISIELEEVHVLSPGVAVERGRAETKLGDGQPVAHSRYTAIHGRVGESWKMLHVVDVDAEPAEPGANLEQLSWLIGQWVDEDRDSLVEIDCYWDPGGSFLIRDFKVRVEGLLAASGTERIGWDPLRKEIRSWAFDSEGGHTEASWKSTSDGWMVDARGFRADGEPTKATYLLTPMKKDAYHVASTARFAGQLRLDDLDMTIVRNPPLPRANQDTARSLTEQTETAAE